MFGPRTKSWCRLDITRGLSSDPRCWFRLVGQPRCHSSYRTEERPDRDGMTQPRKICDSTPLEER